MPNAKSRVGSTIAAAVLSAAASSAFAFEPIVSLGGEHRLLQCDGGTDEPLATREETDGQLGVIILPSQPGQGPGPAIIQHFGAESWYVLEGTFEFHVGGKSFDGGPGTFVAVDAGQPKGFIAKSAGRILVIYTPGGYEHFFMDWAKLGLKPGPQLGALENQYGVTRP
jgi:mannose-6-phosphate isomerase-like protein (cupin superfamily)